MDWRSDSGQEEYSERPYSTLSGGRVGNLLSRAEFPFILLGGGLLLLLLIFFIFFTGGDAPSDETGRSVPQRLEELESRVDGIADVQQRMDSLEARMMGIEEAVSANKSRMSPDTGLIDQMQGNTRALQKTTERLNLLEKRLNRIKDQVQKIAANAGRQPIVKTSRSSKSTEKSTDKSTAASASSGAEADVHVVREGDTLYSIAKDNNVALDRFLKANGLNENSTIYPGQELKIPRD